LGGLRAVGHYDPGFGNLGELSTVESVQAVNAKTPNILLVALGAYKGQLWIENNKNKLKANIISHLGTTINFLAGTEARAPRLMQFFGIEWMWRILQKPSLLQRYAMDAIALLRLFSSHYIPYWLSIRNPSYKAYQESFRIALSENTQEVVIKLEGTFTHHQRHDVRETFKDIIFRKKNVVLDFQEVDFVDNSFLGLLLLLIKHQYRNGCLIQVKNLNKELEKVFRHNLIDKSFEALQHENWKI
jgi:N-acetylglucosaminyldiphosphoundecaprenol N-acetyl-beta-D-mannosaminyltransferase